MVTRNNRQMYNVLFGLAKSLANKGPEIKLSLQKYSANDTSDLFQCSDSLPWKMENESPVEPSICLNLSLLSGERSMFYGMKKIKKESALKSKGYNYADHIERWKRIFFSTYGIQNNNNGMET